MQIAQAIESPATPASTDTIFAGLCALLGAAGRAELERALADVAATLAAAAVALAAGSASAAPTVGKAAKSEK